MKEVSDRLIVRLARLGALGRDDVPSLDRTQRGLASSLGVGQNSVSKVLARLVAADVVSVHTRHVQGQPKRMKTYELTVRGEQVGRALRRHAEAREFESPRRSDA
jgi:DNA-binding MarR family transcriptional regulator